MKKRLLPYCLSVIFVLTTSVHPTMASPFTEANLSIQDSMEAAKENARALIQLDLQSAIAGLINQQMRDSTEYQSIMTMITLLHKNISDELDAVPEVGAINVEKIWGSLRQYRHLVRERLNASFAVQKVLADQRLAFRMSELVFEKFENQCRSGRSDPSIDFVNPIHVEIPDLDCSVGIFVSGDTNIGSSSGNGSSSVGIVDSPVPSFKGHCNAVNRGTKNLVRASSVMTYAGTSLILAGSAANLTSAAAAGPYVLATAVVLMAVASFMASNDLAKKKTELVNAELKVLLEKATDKDVVRFYRDQCAEKLEMLAPLRKIFASYSSSEGGSAAKMELASTRAERVRFKDASAKSEKYLKLFRLMSAFKSGQCVARANLTASPATAAPPPPPPACILEENGFIVSPLGDVALKPELETSLAQFEEAKSVLKSFNEKFPLEIGLKLKAHDLMEQLVTHFENSLTVATNEKIRLSEIDKMLKEFGDKVQLLVIELQVAKNSSWANNKDLMSELELNNKFGEFKRIYFSLIVKSLNVIFKKTESSVLLNEIRDLQKAFGVFEKNIFDRDEIREFHRSLKNLEQFMRQIGQPGELIHGNH